MKFDTALLHAGRQQFASEVVTPVFHSSTYEMKEGTPYEDIRYARLSNSPNHQVLQERLSRLMGVDSSIVTGSGMAAISLVMRGLLERSSKLVVASTIYGGTAGLLSMMEREAGLEIVTFDPSRPSDWAKLDTDGAGVIYAETVANPTMTVADLDSMADFARERGLVSVVDNTFGSPVAIRPAEYGIDVVVHSATKYLNGHSDVTAGVVGGAESMIAPLRKRLAYMGAMLDPGAAYLFERGLKTLSVRVVRQSESALYLVEKLEERPEVSSVHHPYRGQTAELGRRLLEVGGGMFSFELEASVNPQRFFEALEYFSYAPSLGGVESLIVRPSKASHAGMSAAERKRMGIGDRLVRVSTGLEDATDLLDDLTQALDEACR